MIQEILHFRIEPSHVDAIHEGVVPLHVKWHHYALPVLEELPPCKAWHRIRRMQLHRMPEARERHLGERRHEQKVISSRFIFQRGMRFHISHLLGSSGGKLSEILNVVHRAEAEQVLTC